MVFAFAASRCLPAFVFGVSMQTAVFAHRHEHTGVVKFVPYFYLDEDKDMPKGIRLLVFECSETARCKVPVFTATDKTINAWITRSDKQEGHSQDCCSKLIDDEEKDWKLLNLYQWAYESVVHGSLLTAGVIEGGRIAPRDFWNEQDWCQDDRDSCFASSFFDSREVFCLRKKDEPRTRGCVSREFFYVDTDKGKPAGLNVLAFQCNKSWYRGGMCKVPVKNNVLEVYSTGYTSNKWTTAFNSAGENADCCRRAIKDGLFKLAGKFAEAHWS